MERLFQKNGEAVTCLLLGGSGTGKSFAIRHLAMVKNLPTALYGGDKKDYKGVKNLKLLSSIEEAKHMKDSVVIIDDIFDLPRREHEAFRSLILFSRRHLNLSLFIGAHTLMHTRLGNLVHLMSFVIFTRGKPNDPNFKMFMDKIQSDNIRKRDFLDIPKLGYLVWCSQTETARVLTKHFVPPGGFNAEEKRRQTEELLRGMEEILSVFPDLAAMGTCLAKFILSNINPFLVNKTDYTIQVNVRRGKKVTKTSVSFVDYLLATQRSSTAVTADLWALKIFFDSKFVIPRGLIKNRGLM